MSSHRYTDCPRIRSGEDVDVDIPDCPDCRGYMGLSRIDPELRKAFRFHLEHGGWCDPPGRAACALAAARAEAAFLRDEADGLARFRIEDEDMDPADSFEDERDIEAVRSGKVAWVCAILETRDTPCGCPHCEAGNATECRDGKGWRRAPGDSLGGISCDWRDVADPPRGYLRVVRAEMAMGLGMGAPGWREPCDTAHSPAWLAL